MYRSQWGSLAAACNLQNAVVFTKLRKNSYQVLQVMGATSKHAKKLKVCTITLSP